MRVVFCQVGFCACVIIAFPFTLPPLQRIFCLWRTWSLITLNACAPNTTDPSVKHFLFVANHTEIYHCMPNSEISENLHPLFSLFACDALFLALQIISNLTISKLPPIRCVSVPNYYYCPLQLFFSYMNFQENLFVFSINFNYLD